MPQAKRRGANRHRHSNSGSGNGNEEDGDGEGSGDVSSGDEQSQPQAPHSGRPYEDEQGRILPGVRISDTSADPIHENHSRRGSGGNVESGTSAQNSPRNTEHDRERDRDGRMPYPSHSYSSPSSIVVGGGGGRSPYAPTPPHAHGGMHGNGNGYGHGHHGHGNGNGHGHGRVTTPEKSQLSPLPYTASGGGMSPVTNGALSAVSSGVTSPSSGLPMIGGVPIRPASDAQATQRKRQSANGGKGSARSTSNYGPKVVACNFCRGEFFCCDENRMSRTDSSFFLLLCLFPPLVWIYVPLSPQDKV